MTAERCIVVGYDGSADARSAVTWAATAAVALGARLRVVHAVGLLEHAGMARSVDVDGDVAREIAAEAGLATGEVEWCVVDGDPTSVLLRMVEPPEAAILLVVGSRGSGGHAGTLLGSTSLELAKHTRVPVTIVPPLGRSSSRGSAVQRFSGSADHDHRARGVAAAVLADRPQQELFEPPETP